MTSLTYNVFQCLLFSSQSAAVLCFEFENAMVLFSSLYWFQIWVASVIVTTLSSFWVWQCAVVMESGLFWLEIAFVLVIILYLFLSWMCLCCYDTVLVLGMEPWFPWYCDCLCYNSMSVADIVLRLSLCCWHIGWNCVMKLCLCLLYLSICACLGIGILVTCIALIHIFLLTSCSPGERQQHISQPSHCVS